MNKKERKKLKRKDKKEHRRKEAHIWSHGTEEHVEYVKVQMGNNEDVYHACHYDGPEELFNDVVCDLKRRKVTKVFQHDEVKPPEPEETLARCLIDHFEFNAAVRCLADAAKGFESWEQVQASLEESEEEDAQAALRMLGRIKDKLMLVEFCGLVADKDNQERWIDSDGKEPLNHGLDRLKEIYCGKTRAERMIVINPSPY